MTQRIPIKAPSESGDPGYVDWYVEYWRLREAETIPRLQSLVRSMWLYIGQHDESHLTTEERELLYDALDASCEPGEKPYSRWWRS